jgi:hypothetical protein
LIGSTTFVGAGSSPEDKLFALQAKPSQDGFLGVFNLSTTSYLILALVY